MPGVRDNISDAQSRSKSKDPYESGMVGGRPHITFRTGLEGRVVAVLTSKREQRGIKLIHPWTRCIKCFEVHELLLTDETGVLPGGTINRVAAIAFIEFSSGGLVMEGDTVIIGNHTIGKIAGFDETHFPNHMNIVLKGPKRITGLEFGIKGGDRVIFKEEERNA